MISVYPAFYKDFRCKADRCVHSCCMQNWDIDIDEATAMKYLVMTGEPGETIRASMTGTKGNRRFIMKDGRCPLLQEDGLCRIIAETGEENLCDICAMHPRFFVENGNFELTGVGLACEESVELLLSNSTPLLFMEDSAPFSIRLSHAAFRYGLQSSRRSALLYADHQ
jgi:lysine-N-methylase